MEMHVKEVLGNRGSAEVLLLWVCPSRTSLSAHLITLHSTLAWQVLLGELGFLLFTNNCIKTSCA